MNGSKKFEIVRRVGINNLFRPQFSGGGGGRGSLDVLNRWTKVALFLEGLQTSLANQYFFYFQPSVLSACSCDVTKTLCDVTKHRVTSRHFKVFCVGLPMNVRRCFKWECACVSIGAASQTLQNEPLKTVNFMESSFAFREKFAKQFLFFEHFRITPKKRKKEKKKNGDAAEVFFFYRK